MNFVAGSDPVYAPNSYGGPKADPTINPDPSYGLTGEIVRSAYQAHREDSDFVQPGSLYRDVMSETDRGHLLTNIVNHASHGPGLQPAVAERVGEYWRLVDADLGSKVAKELNGGH
jgi:catalase